MKFRDYLFVFSSCLWGCLQAATTPRSSSEGSANAFADNSPLLPLVTFGDKDYYFGTRYLVTFLEALQFCEDIHMDLVRVQSKEENDFLYKYTQDKTKVDHFWTAGSKLVDGNNWIWMTTGEVIAYNNWGSGQPDNPSTELCLELWLFRNKGLVYNDIGCNSKYSVICEKDKGRTQVTPADKNKAWSSVFQNSNVSPGVNLLHFEGKSYYFGRYFKGTYLQATQFCQLINMKLLSITSEEENTRLHKYIRSTAVGDSFWSSGTRALDGTNWVWLSTGAKIEKFNWKSGQPDNANEMCLQLEQSKETGLFCQDYGCDSQFNFICETSDYQNSGGTQVSPKPTTSAPVIVTKEPPEQYPENPSLPVTTASGRRYRVSKLKATEEKASQTCKQYGMELVSIPDKKKNDILVNLIQQAANPGPGNNYWTSGRKQSNDKWIWADQQPITYTNWDSGEPNNADKNETCLHLFPAGTWNDLRCDAEFYFICESSSSDSSTNCPSQPVVNIYLNNNQCSGNTGGGSETKQIATTGDGGGCNVEVNNNIGTCSATSKPPELVPIKNRQHTQTKNYIDHKNHKDHKDHKEKSKSKHHKHHNKT